MSYLVLPPLILLVRDLGRFQGLFPLILRGVLILLDLTLEDLILENLVLEDLGLKDLVRGTDLDPGDLIIKSVNPAEVGDTAPLHLLRDLMIDVGPVIVNDLIKNPIKGKGLILVGREMREGKSPVLPQTTIYNFRNKRRKREGRSPELLLLIGLLHHKELVPIERRI